VRLLLFFLKRAVKGIGLRNSANFSEKARVTCERLPCSVRALQSGVHFEFRYHFGHFNHATTTKGHEIVQKKEKNSKKKQESAAQSAKSAGSHSPQHVNIHRGNFDVLQLLGLEARIEPFLLFFEAHTQLPV
jgi:hypothetical protein